MTEHLQSAVKELMDAGLSAEEVDALCTTMKNAVLMDPEVGISIRRRIISDGDLRFRFIEQAESWAQGWEYPEALLPHVRHFAVQVANLYLS